MPFPAPPQLSRRFGRVRILFVGANRQIVGGAEAYQRTLTPALLSAGHEAALLYERTARPDAPTVDGGAIPHWTDFSCAVEWRPDVAYVHGVAAPSFEQRVLQAFPAVLFAHGYHGTCATGTKRHAWPQVVACKRRLGFACLMLHYPRRCGGLNPLTALESYRTQRERHRLLDRYRAVCVASRHMREEYLRHGLPASRVHVLPLPPTGITPDRSPGNSAFGSGTILFVGRLTDLKFESNAIDAVARAAARLERRLTLTVVGDGPARAGLRRRAERLGVPATFVPWVEPEERNRLFRSAEILLIPSTWPEPWGLVGLEAACTGLPAVAFATGGIPEWLSAGDSGELAPSDPPTTEGLAAAIGRALANRDHYARLRLGAWRRAHEFTLKRHVAELVSVLRGAAEAGA
jgi:glycosyltransferase involved in cell wall biosynthesis